ncbi:response regulator transcription factor [Achromobacter sp. GG226]|uniref:response regulator transcription factor n=1 Tax=Verticiella alkaliphila TaxID=2779529 RepID=UPI001C0E7B81|nr:response regulator transcription factor [Verticiella sp. GG226]MBU4611900.1 response regulator transcription factor [Verticiella sp. GG226]
MTAPLLPALDMPLPAPALIIEDEPLLQQRLSRILIGLGYDAASVIAAGALGEARARLAMQSMGLALVDLMLPDGSGLTLIEEMRAANPGLGILVISAWSTEAVILSALRAGATGYVLKERDDIEVSMSIRSVLRGGAPIDPFIARRILELLPAGAQPPALPQAAALSEREAQILQLVAVGLTNREIAEQLFLSRYTVESHIKHIYRKLAVSTRTMAVNTARRHGVIE